MARVIYFQLGERDSVSLSSLLHMLKEVKNLLSDFDAALSDNPLGTIRWEVAVLEKNSPVKLGLKGEIIERRGRMAKMPTTFVDKVSTEFMRSTARLSNSAKRSQHVSDSALGHYKNLALTSKRLGEITVFDDDRRIPINETTLQHISQLTGTKSKSVGSIIGRLDTISVHNSNEIRVWDENSERPIRCIYAGQLEETVKALLRKRVMVSGLISYNEFGKPTKLDIATLDEYGRLEDLPTIEQMEGLVDDLTGGATLSEYLSHLRDDDE